MDSWAFNILVYILLESIYVIHILQISVHYPLIYEVDVQKACEEPPVAPGELLQPGRHLAHVAHDARCAAGSCPWPVGLETGLRSMGAPPEHTKEIYNIYIYYYYY